MGLDRDLDQDFAEFVGARWTSLYRLAYLLAASPAGAEDLLQTTLEKAYMGWGRISAMEYPEAYVRRMIQPPSGLEPGAPHRAPPRDRRRLR